VFFRNNARPNIAIELPRTLTEDQLREFVKGWESLRGGLENAHKIAVLQGGAKLTQFSINARDSQLLEGRQFEVREIALWLGLPPHKLGDSTKASYNSLEQENQDYLDGGLDPWLVRHEEESWDKLLAEEEKRSESHEIQFNRKALVRANLADRANYYQKATGNRAWLLPDEVREEEGHELLGGDAAQLKDPANVGSTQPAEPDKPPPKRKAPGEQAIALVLGDAASRMVRRLGHAARGAAKKPGEFLDWLDSFGAEHIEVVTEALTPAAALLDEQPGAIAAQICEEVRESLLDASGACKPIALAETIDARIIALEQQLPQSLILDYLGDLE
jgi:hypothetical protein